MNVDLADGCCRECGGQLKIIGGDDATLAVECECGETYDVETDAFGDGCAKYHFALQVAQLEKDGTWTVPDARRYLLAGRLEEYLEGLNPIENRPSAFADLLGAALEDVNYDELAADFLDDLAP